MRDLTYTETDFITAHRRCPICEEGTLMRGPCALGTSWNVRCESCGCEMWIAIYDDRCLAGGILDRDLPEVYSEENIFPLPGTQAHYEETLRLCRHIDKILAQQRTIMYLVISLLLAAATYVALK